MPHMREIRERARFTAGSTARGRCAAAVRVRSEVWDQPRVSGESTKPSCSTRLAASRRECTPSLNRIRCT